MRTLRALLISLAILAVSAPAFAQNWVVVDGTNQLRVRSSQSAVTIRQNGTGNILSLQNAAGVTVWSVAVSGQQITSNNIAVPSGGSLGAGSNFFITGIASGQLKIQNDAVNSGIGFDVTTDGTLKLRNRAETAGSGNLDIGGKITAYSAITTAGTGVAIVVAQANIAAQSSNATITSFANPATDADFEVSGQMDVTVSTTLATSINVTYTDVSNTARTLIMPIQPLTGTFTAAGAISGAGASIWGTPVMHIRAKASTTITVLTAAGTFTGVTYSASAVIKKTS